MLFNSFEFIFLFLPLTYVGYCMCGKVESRFEKGKWRESVMSVFLLAASLIFYGWIYPHYLPILIGSMAVNYGLGRQLEKTRSSKLVLGAGLILNLGMLCVFKYLDTGDFVPLAISFFTFTQIAFLMECYRGNLKGTKLLSYGVYVTWFPKMVQGPIALPAEMLPQIDKKSFFSNWEIVYRNLYLFTLGLFKKVLIADTLGKAVDFGYAGISTLSSWDGLIVMLAYTLQLYFDFSGYCDMAMGISGMFGIELPLNFNSPYKAANILEFWKGWHMTLTRFFTKYLYIPLGGSRKGKARTYLNCFLVFVISGIWHGSGVTFLVWGIMHGALYVLTRIYKESPVGIALAEKWAGIPVKWLKRLGHGVAVLLTFLYVNVAWVFFRSPSLKEAGELLKVITSFKGGRVNWNLASCFNLDEFWYVIKVLHIDRWQYSHYILMVMMLVVTLLLVFFGKNAVNHVKTVKPNVINAIILAVLFAWSVISLSGVSTFLYVNF